MPQRPSTKNGKDMNATVIHVYDNGRKASSVLVSLQNEYPAFCCVVVSRDTKTNPGMGRDATQCKKKEKKSYRRKE